MNPATPLCQHGRDTRGGTLADETIQGFAGKATASSAVPPTASSAPATREAGSTTAGKADARAPFEGPVRTKPDPSVDRWQGGE